MATFTIVRQWVSAADLGTVSPWIKTDLVIEARNLTHEEGWIRFLDELGNTIFEIREEEVISIEKNHALGKANG